MRRSFSKDDVNFQDSEWFVAEITDIGAPIEDGCGGIPYGWQLLDYCSTGDGFEVVGTPDLFGTTTIRQAYAIDNGVTLDVGAIVLMRLRGTFEGQTVYEFMTMGAGGGGQPCFGVKSVSCSSGILLVTLADSGGCLNCMTGMALYKMGTKLTVSNNSSTGVPSANWSLLFGDLTDAGLSIDGDTFKNAVGSEIKVRVTLQYYWTPTSANGTTRSAYCVRNASASDIPVASFVASNDTNVAQVATNIFTLGIGDYFQPFAYQNSGAAAYLGDPADAVPTTLLIERLC